MSVIKKGREARAVLEPGDDVLDAKQQATLLAMVEEGATTSEVCRRYGMPRLGAVWRTVGANAEFAAALKAAEATGAKAMLDEAHDYMRDAQAGFDTGNGVRTVDVDAVRVAESYMKITQAYVEKVAPRQYGPLVKIAGDAEAAAITINLTKFSDAETPAE